MPGHRRDRCGRCTRPLRWSELLSHHRTSDGVVGYRRCACRRLIVEIDGVTVAGHTESGSQPRRVVTTVPGGNP